MSISRLSREMNAYAYSIIDISAQQEIYRFWKSQGSTGDNWIQVAEMCILNPVNIAYFCKEYDISVTHPICVSQKGELSSPVKSVAHLLDRNTLEVQSDKVFDAFTLEFIICVRDLTTKYCEIKQLVSLHGFNKPVQERSCCDDDYDIFPLEILFRALGDKIIVLRDEKLSSHRLICNPAAKSYLDSKVYDIIYMHGEVEVEEKSERVNRENSSSIQE